MRVVPARAQVVLMTRRHDRRHAHAAADRSPTRGRGKNAVGNRERFLRRYKAQMQRRGAEGWSASASIRDIEQGGDVRVPRRTSREPSFGHGRGGDREIVLPGNRSTSRGDRIARPQGGGGQRRRQRQAGDGEGEDDFVFSPLARRVHADLLRRPRAAATSRAPSSARAEQLQEHPRRLRQERASPANLAIVRSMRSRSARRIALGGGIARELVGARGRVRRSPSALGHAEAARADARGSSTG